ncbi:protein phosphatase regulator [Ascochyta clinopodiicola]|nr:protein phosphatase regulator [Ascochyta clinopodiicola]
MALLNTIDLQDKSSPTAQDHSNQPQHPAPLGIGPPAPHQQASLQSVEDERNAEESRLQNAWNNAGTSLRDDPGSDDERTTIDHTRGQNAQQHDDDDDDMQDADAEEDMDDDDMLDKMSSSPSIDDVNGASSCPAMQDGEPSPRTRQLRLVERRLQLMREDSQASLMSELDLEHAGKMLQAVHPPSFPMPDDPFVETVAPAPRSTNGTPPPPKHIEDEDDSWTTDSDADSWDEDLDNEDDASNDFSFSDDPRFVDSGWGGECLRETEDIDFEFVYALHTFVATVEGQANATKGDTMVLLDDSNSYWWLVRVVKDSSIGYLPAEHIETPTERLARLNKHRNIDLSATMLGDTAEKTKNPLKKAMRRRNAKTVQFGAPTYVEASDYDYSSDEEGGELFGGPEPKQAQQQEQQEETAQKAEVEQDDSMQVQPLKLGGVKKVSSEESRTSSEEAGADDDKSRTSDEIFDRPLDQKVSRNGTLRNTDSFFKDENTETRKITLTPNLLRDDSSTSTTGSRERGPSLESLEKNGFADKVKDDKKKKDKKSGMLSGLFKRKDKKDKDSKGDVDTIEADLKKAIEKPEPTSPQAPQTTQATQAKPAEVSPERQSEEQVGPAPSRQSSKGKLQKQQRARTDSPIKTKGILKTDSPMEATADLEEEIGASENRPAGQQTTSTMRIVSPDQDQPQAQPAAQERVKSPESQSVMAAISSKNPFRSNTTTDSAPKPEKVHKAKERVQLDDFDSSEEESDDPFADPDARDKPREQTTAEPVGRLSESPVHVSAADAQPTVKEVAPARDLESDAQQPPGLTGDNSSADTSSRVSTPDLDDATPDTIVPDKLNVAAPRTGTSPSPTLLSPNAHANLIPPPSRAAPAPLNLNTSPTVSSAPVSSESATLPAWSDACLRSYLDDGSEIRDLLLMINDTTGVVPVGKDHPLMSGLFVEESKAAQSISSELDRLLNGLVDNRMKRNGSAASKKSQLSQVSRASTAGGR